MSDTKLNQWLVKLSVKLKGIDYEMGDMDRDSMLPIRGSIPFVYKYIKTKDLATDKRVLTKLAELTLESQFDEAEIYIGSKSLAGTYVNGMAFDFGYLKTGKRASIEFGVDQNQIVLKIIPSKYGSLVRQALIKKEVARLIETAKNVPEWFEALPKDKQRQYIKDHPNSRIAKNLKAVEDEGGEKKGSKVEEKKEGKKGEGKEEAPKQKEGTPALSKKGFTGPKTDKDSISGDKTVDQKIVNNLDRLAQMVNDAKKKGDKAPDYDLCEISVPGTNLFCQKNKGIPRDKMPQLKGKPRKGSWAAENLQTNKDGEVDGEAVFKASLKKNGTKVEEGEVDVTKLKASQNQMVGAKIAGMLQALKENPEHPAITAPIYVSKDGFIMDGHHRWAAMVALRMAQGDKNKPVKMKVIKVDKTAMELIDTINQFCDSIGIEAKPATATAALFHLFGDYKGCCS